MQLYLFIAIFTATIYLITSSVVNIFRYCAGEDFDIDENGIVNMSPTEFNLRNLVKTLNPFSNKHVLVIVLDSIVILLLLLLGPFLLLLILVLPLYFLAKKKREDSIEKKKIWDTLKGD